VWLGVNILLLYCLVLRSAPHHFEAENADCTFLVLQVFTAGAPLWRIGKDPQLPDIIKQLLCQVGKVKGGFAGWRLRLTRPAKPRA